MFRSGALESSTLESGTVPTDMVNAMNTRQVKKIETVE